MSSVRSHTFCCCIPVRFGAVIMTTLFLLGGSVFAAVGWHGATHKGTWASYSSRLTSLTFCRTITPDPQPGSFPRHLFHFIYPPCLILALRVRLFCAACFRAT